MDWKEKARQRRLAQAEAIPKAWRLTRPESFSDSRPIIESSSVLTDLDKQITNTTDARTIQNNILTHKWSCEQVAVAFCKRAALAQQLTNCLTEILFNEAIAQAKGQDEHYKTTGKPIGPFHGIPVSLKDSHDIKGVDTTLGWVGMISKPAAEDNIAVQQYKQMGAIIYCKTNIPQSLMMSDSYNHVFGQSVNAFNPTLISGGSSGGEGALLGARGSVIGIGTDIGGSIRIPAVLQGLYGLCPTIGRVPNRESGRNQKYVVPPVAGPMATSLSSVEMFMGAFSAIEPWCTDPQSLPIPWRRELAKPPQHLKIAYVMDDGVVLPHPPVQRAMREMLEKLQQAGHEVVEWDCTSHKSAYYDLWLPAVLADGGKRFEGLCKMAGEPLIEGMLVGKPQDYLGAELRQDLAENIWHYQRKYLQRWQAAKIDAILMPVLPWVGMRPKTWVRSQQYCGYTAHWNLLNYTALAIPATSASRDLDKPDSAWESHVARGFTDKFNHDLYDLDLVDGMPVGLQIITGRFEEEKAVGIAKVMERLR